MKCYRVFDVRVTVHPDTDELLFNSFHNKGYLQADTE